MPKRKKSDSIREETVEEKIIKDAKRKIARQARLEKAGQTSWRKVDLNEEHFVLHNRAGHQEYSSPATSPNDSMADIFFRFMPSELVEEIWAYYPIDTWSYGSQTNKGTINKGYCSLYLVYFMFAVYILISGFQEAPKENQKNFRPLRSNIVKAINYIKERRPNVLIPGILSIETLVSRFLIPSQFYLTLSWLFIGAISIAGRFFAGDEKLLRFLGDSSLIRQIITKPDKVGFWFYELVCAIDQNTNFLLFTRVQDSCPEVGESIPTLDVVQEWGQIVLHFKEKNNNQGPVLVADSYYPTDASREWCYNNKVHYIMAVQTNRFNLIMDAMKLVGDPVTKPGQSAAITNPDTQELFVHHWDPDVNIDKKYVLSNAFIASPTTRRTAAIDLPAYPHYKHTFNLCDRVNRGFHDRKFCHRTGGNRKRGQDGHVHKFFMAAIVQNVFALHGYFKSEEEKKKDFKLKCVELAFDIIDQIKDI